MVKSANWYTSKYIRKCMIVFLLNRWWYSQRVVTPKSAVSILNAGLGFRSRHVDNDLDVVATGGIGDICQICDSAKREYEESRRWRRGDPPQITPFAVWIWSLYRADSYGFVGFACLHSGLFFHSLPDLHWQKSPQTANPGLHNIRTASGSFNHPSLLLLIHLTEIQTKESQKKWRISKTTDGWGGSKGCFLIQKSCF